MLAKIANVLPSITIGIKDLGGWEDVVSGDILLSLCGDESTKEEIKSKWTSNSFIHIISLTVVLNWGSMSKQK